MLRGSDRRSEHHQWVKERAQLKIFPKTVIYPAADRCWDGCISGSGSGRAPGDHRMAAGEQRGPDDADDDQLAGDEPI